jgi:hypothetical protein
VSDDDPLGGGATARSPGGGTEGAAGSGEAAGECPACRLLLGADLGWARTCLLVAAGAGLALAVGGRATGALPTTLAPAPVALAACVLLALAGGHAYYNDGLFTGACAVGLVTLGLLAGGGVAALPRADASDLLWTALLAVHTSLLSGFLLGSVGFAAGVGLRRVRSPRRATA